MAKAGPVSLRRGTITYIIAICAIFAGIEGWREWSLRAQAIERTEIATANLARSLRQHAEDTFELAETAVASLVQQLEASGSRPSALQEVRSTMRAEIGVTSRFRALFVYDASGVMVATSLDPVPRVIEVSDRAYFQYHKSSLSKESFFSDPLRSKTSGAWILTISRRFNNPDGSFGGVVLASIDSAYFSAIYSEYNVGRQGALVLSKLDGTLLARFPYDDLVIGSDRSATPLFTDYLPEAPFGAYHFTSSIDQVNRISGYNKSPHFPVVLIAAVSTDEALQPWFAEALRRAAWTVAFMVLLCVLGLRLSGQIDRRRRSEAETAARDAEFRMVAENVGDLVERFGPDGKRVYASPAMERMFGVKPGEMIGREGSEMMHPDDLAMAIKIGTKLLKGQSVEETIVFRSAPSFGPVRWLESSLRAVPGPDGTISIVTVTRDVSDRKQRELTLEAMATIDPLTNLGNRRSFDTSFEREVLRTRRNGTPLSLLLVDADRFKLYNDTYGHPEGDLCLKAIAREVKAAAKRPADLAARYGGEEFAILLPETDLKGAAFIAAEFCKSVEALAIRHEENVPWKIVTVSVGIATLTGKQRDGGWLISAADAALYEAKDRGRNRYELGQLASPLLKVVSA